MQITTRATVLAAALLASAPLLAAGSGTGTDVPTQETPATEQDDCWLPSLPSTDISAIVDRDLSEAASCVRPLGLWNDEPEDSGSSKRGYSFIATPAGIGTTWPRQRSFLEGSPGTDGLSIIPAKAGFQF